MPKLGIPSLLARRTSQHDRHRQRGHGRGDRICRGRDARRSVSGQAASCCRITRRSWWRNNSARSNLSYPGRIDLGGPRAGHYQRTARALRRNPPERGEFSSRRAGTAGLFRAAERAGGPRSARLGSSRAVWMLGSSLFGAQLAAALACPAFASHFAPAALMQALQLSHHFKPSEQLTRPYAAAAVT